MATNALTCSAATLVSNNMASRSLLPVGLGRHPVLPPTPSSKAPSSRPSLVVKAQQSGGTNNDDKGASVDLKEKDPLVTFPFVRTPWSKIEKENEIRMWFNMPGTELDNIDVKVEHGFLVIRAFGDRDLYEKKIFSSHETKLHLPFYASKEDNTIRKYLKNGMLHITVPKVRKGSDDKDANQATSE